MKTLITAFASIALLGLIGCDHNSQPGGPGAKTPPDKTPSGADNTFKIDTPNMAVSLKQGESKPTSISLKKQHNFDEDVTLSFGTLPQGVTIDPASPAIKHGSDEAKFTVKAADDAAIGDFTVQVTGTPTHGAAASNTMKISVSKK